MKRRAVLLGAGAGVLVAALVACEPAPPTPPTMEAVATANGVQVHSAGSLITPDGRYVIFSSFAGDIIPGFKPAPMTLYRKDRKAGVTEAVSVQPDGSPSAPSLPASAAENYSISDDGRYVVWNQGANTLVPGDTEGQTDVFVRDMVTKKTTRVSQTGAGVGGNGESRYPRISGNGNWVTFTSTANNLGHPKTDKHRDVYRWNRLTGEMKQVSVGFDASRNIVDTDKDSDVSIPLDDGRVVYQSVASNLIPKQTLPTTATRVLIANPDTRAVDFAAKTGNGAIPPAYISDVTPDGKFLSFTSSGTWWDGVAGTHSFIRNLQTGVVEAAFTTTGGVAPTNAGAAYLSNDGRFVYFASSSSSIIANDTNGAMDAFLRDRSNGKVIRVNRQANGSPMTFSINSVRGITDDGKLATFLTGPTIVPPGSSTNGFDKGTITTTNRS